MAIASWKITTFIVVDFICRPLLHVLPPASANVSYTLREGPSATRRPITGRRKATPVYLRIFAPSVVAAECGKR
jgi:hypothetical protein